MMAVTDLNAERTADVWDDRLQALDGLMYAMTRDYDTLSLSRWGTLKPLLKCLQAYGRDQFAYFRTGFNTGRLEAWDEYPPEAIYSIVLNQIGYDLEVWQRAVEQRLAGPAAMTHTLKEADKLAWLALKPAIDLGLLPADTTVVTYFQKSPVSRVIPYAPVALIGIPFTCLSAPRDQLAIPHEVGHYVFWHARVPAGQPNAGVPLQQVLRERAFEALKTYVTLDSPEFPAWCYRWLEELFADVYGTLIGGPVIALDFQDLSLHNSCDDFITSDEDHPVPILRPEVYIKVLQRAANPDNGWAVWAEALRQRWQTRRIRCGGRDHFLAGGRAIRLDEAISTAPASADLRPVDRLVLVAMEVLTGMQSDWSGSVVQPVYAQNGKVGVPHLDDLYDSQRAALPGLLAQVTAELDPDGVTGNRWVNAAENLISAYGADFVKVAQWRERLIANGWTTEGPQTRWP